jgi:hypothetical protein
MPVVTTTVIDVPAFNVDDDAHSILGSNNLSTTDTGTELVLDQSSQPLRIHLYSVDGTGSGNIVLPETPPGATLVGAAYVVIAYAESSESGDLTDWSPDEPDPTQLPFLMIESSRTATDGHTLDPIPVGAYAGETVHEATHDLGFILAGTPANRIWRQSVADTTIHVAYAAVRLTYSGLPDGFIAGGLGPRRTRFV